MSQIEITDKNFEKYFFDARLHRPKVDQVLVCYSAMADFGAGPEKTEILRLLNQNGSAVALQNFVKKALSASELDSVQLPLRIAEDLKNGLSEEEIYNKLYRYKLEMLFYTWEEYVPEDPHWTSISLLNLTEKNKIETIDPI